MKQLLCIFFLFPLFNFAQYEEYDWEQRDEWMPVDAIFEAIDLKEGMKVADIGCHEGYMSIKLAEFVGEKGQVFAVDIRADRLDLLRSHLQDRKIQNVEVVLGDYDDPKLPKEHLDAVIIIDTYHEMTEYERILKKVMKSLKPGGKLLIFEKLKNRVKDGTRDEQTDSHTLSSKFVIDELKEARFTVTKQKYDLGYWEEDNSKPMWFVVAEKPDDSKFRVRKL